MITLVPKLLGSEGMKAAAGEIGWRHFEKFFSAPALAGMVLTLGVIFAFGRILCAYACPVGVFQELLYIIREDRIESGRISLPVRWTFWLRLLFLTLLLDCISFLVST